MSRQAKRIALRILVAVTFAQSCAVSGADPAKVLRVALPDLETLDPCQYNDSPSFDVISVIFEGLYEWDYLASSPTLAPVLAAGPPEISADALTWKIRLKQGVYFTDDPAFNGKPREVVAQDVI